MNTAPQIDPIAPEHPNRIIELASQLDSHPASSMSKSERRDERRKMLISYRAYLAQIESKIETPPPRILLWRWFTHIFRHKPIEHEHLSDTDATRAVNAPVHESGASVRED
jgi:hypothetical protein